MTNPAPGATNEVAELLPCPFCGGQPTISKRFKGELYGLAHRCEVVGPIDMDWCDSQNDLAAAWNARALIADSRDNIRLDCMSNGSDPSLFLSPFDAVLAQIDEVLGMEHSTATPSGNPTR